MAEHRPHDGSAQAAKDGRAGKGNQGDKPKSTTRARFYDRVLTQDEIALVAELAANPSLSEEIALLKVLIRRKLEEGTDLETIIRAVDALGRALKVQEQIPVEGHRALQEALLEVLTELGEQEEPPRRRTRKDVVVR